MNSRRAVDTYVRELSDYRRVAADPKAQAALLDFTVYLRERTVALATEETTFTAADLEAVAAAGRERGAAGITPASHWQALLLHSPRHRPRHEPDRRGRRTQRETFPHTCRRCTAHGAAR